MRYNKRPKVLGKENCRYLPRKTFVRSVGSSNGKLDCFKLTFFKIINRTDGITVRKKNLYRGIRNLTSYFGEGGD